MDAVQAAATVARRFPELAGLPLTPLGAGLDHVAFEVGGQFVLRVGGDGLATEARLTAVLAPLLPLAVPQYRWLAEASAATPAMGAYPRLPGDAALSSAAPVDAAVCGPALGAVLRVLHGLDPARFTCLGVTGDLDPTLADWRDAALADVEAVRGACPEVLRLEAVFAAPPGADGVAPRLIHGDLAAEHVLVDAAGRPVGLIDWSDAALGDPARDLAGLLHWGGPPMLSAAEVAYGAVPASVRERARWYALCRAVADLRYGIERGLPEYVAAAGVAVAHLTAG